MNIKILIADDYKMMRDDLCSLLELQTNMTVVGEAENGLKAIQPAQKLHPNVIVMDISGCRS
ncbi:MAG: response regulator transcription factor [Dissulfuribacterales bacterium]